MEPTRKAAIALPRLSRPTPRRGLDYADLKPVSGRLPVRDYLRQLWGRRHFIWAQAWAQALSRNRGMVLGNLWLILNPLFDAAVYVLIFGVLFQSRIVNFPSYVVIGVFMFSFTTRCLTSGIGAIPANVGMIRGFSFPRASLPVAIALREAVQTLPTMVVMFVIVHLLSHHWPKPEAIMVPFLFALQCVFNLGLTFVAARIGSAFPDARHLMSYITRLLMYASAVIWSVDRFDNIPNARPIVDHQPLYILINMYREMLMRGYMPRPGEWVQLAGWAILVLVVGFVFFWRGEVSYGRIR
ncbi:ABC transporter permease [Aestuariimicrobium soli]|uniref:ABC transporter permease n=1 Tax=Aestuariimicrobium soli TaxID=2035834 RepID=UPI003EBD25BC